VYAVGLTSVLSAGAAELVSRVTTVGLLWLGTVMVLRQTLSPGELMSFYALNGHLTGPVLGLIAANRRVQDALVAADRLFDILDLEREGDNGSIELRPTTASEAIGFRKVCFRYGTRPPLFDELSLGIPRGSFTALVGESGSGKSTFAALLQRLYTPESGQILIGGMDIRHVRRDSLLRTVAVVPQDAILLTGSILENLAPGEHAPDLANIVAVCERVGIREFVDGLPAGFATPLGERGVDLSGGQRQRLAIARALYRQPNVVVLDEATSGLDATTENLIYQELRRLQSDGLTVIVITHRLTTAMHADGIIVLAHGKLVEQGTHRELVERTGIYQRLWLQQTAGVLTSQGPAGPPQAPPRSRGAAALTGDAVRG
jgi:ATP-binding cassette subfamily B protein